MKSIATSVLALAALLFVAGAISPAAAQTHHKHHHRHHHRHHRHPQQ